MQIIEVGSNRKLQKEFLAFPVRLYKGNPYWIRPLDNDIEKIFNPEKNPLLKGDNCVRWLAIDEHRQTIARVAAFVNPNTVTHSNDQPTGGLGFFECIDDEKVAFAMFDQCKAWLKEKGMEAMDGPINFGERDNWWGLLVDPYDAEPTWSMFYHHTYYRKFFEDYGFEDYFQQYTFLLPLEETEARKVVRPALFEIANRIYNTPGYDFRHVNKKQLSKFAQDFRIIYNKVKYRTIFRSLADLIVIANFV